MKKNKMHHAECVSVAKTDTSLVWTCFSCRLLPLTVNELKQELKEMCLQQKEIMKLLSDINAKLGCETDAKMKIAHELKEGQHQ